MEYLVDPGVFESRIGVLVGVALLAVLFAAILVGYASEKITRRNQRAAERTAGADVEDKQTRRAA